MTKTCQNCKHYIAEMYHCSKNDVMAEAHNTCEDFDPKVTTNGDKIIAGGMRAIAEFVDEAWKYPCRFCVYAKYIEDFGFGEGGFECKNPDEKDCVDGFEAWLNAPAESEGKDE